MMCVRIRGNVENRGTAGEQLSGHTGFVGHYLHTGWMLLTAAVAVGAGFATMNMMLADSGLAVLNEHAAPLMAFIGRLTTTRIR